MTKFNRCKFKLSLVFGKCNNKYMTVKVNNLIQKPLDGRVDMELDLVLPENVVIKTSGKNLKYDTKMNSKGEIIEDLYVKIESISLDGFPLSERYIHQLITMNTDDGNHVSTSYLGFNGEVVLEFAEDNAFFQVLKIKNL